MRLTNPALLASLLAAVAHCADDAQLRMPAKVWVSPSPAPATISCPVPDGGQGLNDTGPTHIWEKEI